MCSLLATVLHAQDGFGTYLREVIEKQEKGVLVAAKLIDACGLCDSLDLVMDYEYELRYQYGTFGNYTDNSYYDTYYAPEHRYYGYTLFAETDNFWESVLGKNYKAITATDIAGYIQQHCQFTRDYSNDANYSNPENALYQFVTYHLLNRRLSPDYLVNHYNEREYNTNNPYRYTVPVCEYYTTMGDRRLLRVYESRESDGIFLNRFPVLDNGRQGSYHELSCDTDKAGIAIDMSNAILNDIRNATIYPINQLLAFDQATAQNMGSIRLRMDMASFFPEMASNGIRLSKSMEARRTNVYLPCDKYPYLDDLTINDNSSVFCYNTGYKQGWMNMLGDEFFCTGNVPFDITLRLPPVPTKDTYELRMSESTSGSTKGIVQVYFGTDPDNLSPLGMPIDFRQSFLPYVADTGDDSYDQMIDNEMYENGFMKGCMQYCAGFGGSSQMMRHSNMCLRRILGRQMMEPEKTYYLRFKSLELDYKVKKIIFDYIEFCPESVYDNPNVPEDIW